MELNPLFQKAIEPAIQRRIMIGMAHALFSGGLRAGRGQFLRTFQQPVFQNGLIHFRVELQAESIRAVTIGLMGKIRAGRQQFCARRQGKALSLIHI